MAFVIEHDTRHVHLLGVTRFGALPLLWIPNYAAN